MRIGDRVEDLQRLGKVSGFNGLSDWRGVGRLRKETGRARKSTDRKLRPVPANV
jgi:hypothetical protein